MQKLVIGLLFVFGIQQVSHSALPNGASAPDFTINTLSGSFSLYASMGSNKGACLDVMATWCGPCWSFHQSGVLSEVYNNLSSYTSVVMIEADFATNLNCLYGPSGCVGGTQGDWVTGEPYPIANLSASNGANFSSLYSISYFPTLYVISPDKRVWNIVNRSFNEYESWLVHSFTLSATGMASNSTCGDDGSVILIPTGGYGKLYYKWSNGDVTKDLINVGGGSYTVTVSDDNGYFKKYGPWVINGPAKPVTITNSNVIHNKCNGESNGKISVTASFGTSPYSFDWLPSGTGNTISNLVAGNYTLIITDALGCTLQQVYTVTEPSELTQFSVMSPEQCDELDGKIEIYAGGGVKPYLYDIGFGRQSSSTFNDLKGGYYTITVTDNNKCTVIGNADVLASHKPKIEAGANDAIICPQDSFKLTGEGTSQGSNYSYEWTTRKGKILSNPRNLPIYLNKAGWYVLKVKDLVNACENIDSVEIKDNRVYPDVKATGDGTLTCLINKQKIEGTTTKLTTKYFWTELNSMFYDTSKTLFVTDKGQFVFNVKDTLNQCVSKDTVSILQNTTKPSISVVSPDILNCSTTELNIDAQQSSSGSDFVHLWTTNDGNIKQGQNSLFPLVDKTGNYHLNIKNTVNGCEETNDIFILQDIEIPKIEIKGTTDILKCQSDRLVIDASSSASGSKFSYLWSTVNGNIVSGGSSKLPTVNKPGDYEFYIKNNDNTCQNTYQLKVGEQENPTSGFDFAKQDLIVKFSDQSTGNIKNWIWSFGDGGISNDPNPSHTYLNEGEFEVCLNSVNGCGESKLCKMISVYNSAALNISSWELHSVKCYNGADGFIKVIIQGGSSPYSYLWNTGATTDLITNLAKGIYKLTVTDQSGTTVLKSFVISEPSEIVQDVVNIIGANGNMNNGQINFTPKGGFPPYSYKWSNGELSQNITNLSPGEYTLELLDANYCEAHFGPFVVKDVTSSNSLTNVSIFEIQPNPVSEIGTVRVELKNPEKLSLYLKNSLGKTVWEKEVNGNISNIKFYTGNFPSGIYFINLQSKKGTISKRLIIQN